MGTATVNYKGVELEVEFDYQPCEKKVRYYSDGSGYPGCPESLDLTSIKIDGVDAWDLLEDQVDQISEQLIEDREDYSDY